MKLVDVVLGFFFSVIVVAAPLFDAQVTLPSKFFPEKVVELNLWFAHEYGDYLLIEKPAFFVGLMWLELLFQWPLAIANLYGLLSGKSWFPTTCLVYGVSIFTGMIAVLADMVLSSRLTSVLATIYFPFLGFAILAVLRGLLTCSSSSGQTKRIGETKKRA